MMWKAGRFSRELNRQLGLLELFQCAQDGMGNLSDAGGGWLERL